MEILEPPQAFTRLAILAGAFNPPTRAHLALANAALNYVDAVLWVLPGVLPHKAFTGASADERLRMVSRIASGERRFGAGYASGGLYIDIVREARSHFPEPEILCVCGRDAAQRIVEWDYGDPDEVHRILDEFGLLVAPRGGHYVPPPNLKARIVPLHVEGFENHSSTEVRSRIECGDAWEHLVPQEIVEMVREIYAR